MAQYRLSAKRSQAWFSSIPAAGLILAIGVILFLLAVRFVLPWPGGFPQDADVPVAAILVTAFGVLLVGAVLLLIPRLLRNRTTFEIEVQPDGVLRRWASLHEQFLRREEILGWIDHGTKGMYLVTADPARHISVPGDLEDYAGFQTELVALGLRPIDPRMKRSLYVRSLLPTLVLCAAMAGVWFFQDPLLIFGSGILMLADMYWLSRRSRRSYKTNSRFGLLVGGAFILQFRLLAALDYPAGAKPYLLVLDVLLLFLVVADWFYARLTPPSARAQ